MNPKVTFIVPCYNLAHLLPECIHSILSQTYENFEILIMDDCSPDDTPDVARSLDDPRVKHIRNEKNLRHLANYNKGIGLAQGKYVWLISADDRLRKPYVLERYVDLMEKHPEVGYVFCPVMELKNGQETGVAQWSCLDVPDRIFDGRKFFEHLLPANCVPAAGGMVQRDCYRIEQFPLDLPYAGDWYLWCLFALHHDVAYLREPMVHYRLHEKSYTSFFSLEQKDVIVEDEIEVRWRIMKRAEEAGYPSLARLCLDYIANDYVVRMQMNDTLHHRFGLTYNEFEKSLAGKVPDKKREKYVKAKVFLGLANGHYAREEMVEAIPYYVRALQERPLMWKAWIKYGLSLMKMGHVSGKQIIQKDK